MASLESVRARIRAIQKIAGRGEEEKALSDLHDFLYELIQEDSGFYYIERAGRPHRAPARKDDPRLFLRIFTDSALADSYTSSLDNASSVPVSSIESLQLAKFEFLHGAYGLILNDGDIWTAIPLSDYLSLYLRGAFGGEAEEMISESFIRCCNLISAVRRNSVYRLCYLSDNGSTAITVNGRTSAYILPDGDAMLPTDTSVMIPATMQSLFLFDAPIQVSLGQTDEFTIENPDDLRKALELCGITREERGNIAGSGFYDEPESFGGETSDFHSIRDITLSFQPMEIEEELEEESEEELTQESEEIPETEQSPVRQKIEQGREKIAGASKKTSTILLVIASVILVVVIAVIFRAGMSASRFGNFGEKLDDRDYAGAYQDYLEYEFGEKGDERVAEAIDGLISDYAVNKITAEELNASFQALSNFPHQENNLENARVTASRLEDSKNAFLEGSQTTAIPYKIYCWSKVIPLDEEHYRIVQRETKENEREWSKAVADFVTENAYIDRDIAFEYAKAGAMIYPENEDLTEWRDIFQKEEDRPELSEYPIKIHSLRIADSDNNSISLFIKWENLSTKTISSVKFYFLMLDRDGNPIISERRGNETRVFCGEDSALGMYQPGFIVTSDTWGWKNIWRDYGDKVDRVSLTAVEITYYDGTQDRFSTAKDLAKMQ